MNEPGWWRSFDGMDAIFRVFRNITIATLTFAAVLAILGYTLAAVIGVILATTAILVTLFAWFRRDDLARSRPRP